MSVISCLTLLNYSVVLPPSIPGYVPQFMFDMCNLRKSVIPIQIAKKFESMFEIAASRGRVHCNHRHDDAVEILLVDSLQQWRREYEVPYTRTNYAIGTRYGSPSLITNYCSSVNENQVTRSDILKYLFS